MKTQTPICDRESVTTERIRCYTNDKATSSWVPLSVAVDLERRLNQREKVCSRYAKMIYEQAAKLAKLAKLGAGVICLLMLTGCTVVSANRVFPKLDWYWSQDAKMQRQEDAAHKVYEKAEPKLTIPK